MTTEFKLKSKKEAAEARWEAAQLQAANAQRELDYAIAVVEQGKSELTEDQKTVIDAQIEIQRESIKDFLMKAHTVYQEAILAYQEGMRRLNNA
jgi:small-conductance mechanosensitive channel